MKIISIFLVLAVGTIDCDVRADDDLSPHEIRQLITKGSILSLESILQQYPENDYGKLLDLEVKREDAKVIYELEFLLPDSRVLEIELDARDGRVLEQEIED